MNVIRADIQQDSNSGYEEIPQLYDSHGRIIKRHPLHAEYMKERPQVLQVPNPNPNRFNHSHEDVVLSRYIGSGVAFVSLIADNLLSHPFQVLRRQCQVHHKSKKYHLTPFTLIPTVYHLHQQQGLTALWKGIGSVLLVRGMTIGVEDLISKVTPWPKEISWHCSLKQFFQHTLLKCVSLAIVTPFYSASFVETVQSEIASEKPGILDVFKEGFMRLFVWGGASPKGTMIPIWALILPTVTLGLSRYLFCMLIRGASARLMQIRSRNLHEANGALPKDLTSSVALKEVEFHASIFANIATDIAFYPCETIVHRLYLQGTRTIIDDLDSGEKVLSTSTNYKGAIGCYESCVATEGILGLYKGFGALILQHLAHIAVVRISRFCLTEIGTHIRKPKKEQPVPTDVSPPVISNLTSSRRSYLLP